MKRYKVIKNGVCTNLWYSDFADETHYEESFGLPARPELDESGEPTGNTLPAEYEIQIEDVTAELAAQAETQDALAYLASTDWYVIRALDNGTPCPQDIKDARAAARLKVVR